MEGEAISEVNRLAASSQLDYEEELVRRARDRSQEAWTEIYERNYTRLFRYVQARVGEQQTAEDLTATVFVEALKGITSYRSRGRPLLAWLYAIARNVVNYHHRSGFKKRGVIGRVLSLGGEHEEAPAIPTGSDWDDPAAAVERWDLQDAVRRLSHDQRELIILRYFVGLTTPEVAEVVGKNERAVYSLQTRAIKALRRHLD
jgi:RNA polymerase sigma-70 factor (ECF subfamily)